MNNQPTTHRNFFYQLVRVSSCLLFSMASTPPLIRPVRKEISPSSAPAPLRIASGVGRSPYSDEVIWSKLKEAGFDEEMIKRRDKASLIAYITKLETEVFHSIDCVWVIWIDH